MTIRKIFEVRLTTFLFCALLCFSNITFAEDTQTNSTWKCFNLLDKQTQSSLSSKEQFFAGLFQLPSEYKQATETEKTRLINQWLEELQGNDNEKITRTVAYLGIVKADKAAKRLEKLMTSGKCGGRLRWVCTRSLGQTGDEDTIPILINLLDSPNMETCLYSKVSLAEITANYQETGSVLKAYDKPKDMVEYRTYIVDAENVYWFVFRVEKNKFDENKTEFDSIINSFRSNAK